MKRILQLMAVSLGAIVFSLWIVEMPEAWAKCWTVSGATFCDNREGTGNNNGGQGGKVVPDGPTPAEIEAQAAKERRAKANTFNNAGIAAQNRGEWGIAAEQYRQAHAWNPDSKVIFNNLLNAQYKVGLIAMEEGDWEYAADTFQSLLYQKADSEEFKRLSAVAEKKRQAVRQAYELNRQAIKAADGGDWTTALTYFQQAVQNDPGKPAYANNLRMARQNIAYGQNDQGRSAAQKGDWATALNYFEQAAQTDPAEPAYADNITLAQRKIQEQQNRAVAARVQQNVNTIAEDVKNSKPAGDLDLSDLSTTEDAFGTKKSNPKLTPAEAQKGEGRGTDPGKQLKSAERHSRDAQAPGNDSDKETARKGFDTPGTESGNLVYPDKAKHRQAAPTALDRQIPGGAKDDPQIRQMQAWYRSLDAKKAEKEKMIAEIMEQQKTSKDPVLDAKKATLINDVKRLADDQTKATATVKERVEVIRKQTLDKGLAWDEEPSTDAPSGMKQEITK